MQGKSCQNYLFYFHTLIRYPLLPFPFPFPFPFPILSHTGNGEGNGTGNGNGVGLIGLSRIHWKSHQTCCILGYD